MRLRSVAASCSVVVVLMALGCSAGGDASPPNRGGASGGATNTGGGGGAALGTGGTTVISTGGGGGTDNPCGTTLAVTFRDFSQAHPDFERADPGWGPAKGMVENTLDAEGKPVFLSSTGYCQLTTSGDVSICNNWVGAPMIESADTFHQWYRTIDGVNIQFDKTLEISETPPGSGQYEYSSTQFFPLGNDEGFGITPPNSGHNYLFTTEIHLLFGYVAGQKFTFDGDDDLWIFINGKLALELGGLHGMFAGTIDFDAQAADLGISPGGTYTMDVFHAERHTWASDFKIQTNISCFIPVQVH